MLKLGSTDINKAYLGTTEINKIYLGEDEVYSGGAVQNPLEFISTVNTMGGGNTQVGNFTHFPIHQPFFIGNDSVDLVLDFHNYYIAAGAEGGMGNSYTIESCIIYKDGDSTFYPVTFGGSRSVTVANDAFELQSDPVNVQTLKGEQWWCKMIVSIPVQNQRLPYIGYGANVASGRQFLRILPADTTMSTTDEVGPYTWTGVAPSTGWNGLYFGGLFIIGHPKTPNKARVFIGDSICSGVGDASNYAHGAGFLQRASTTGADLNPCHNLGIPSIRTDAFISRSRWKRYLKYCKYAALMTNTNDTTQGATQVQLQDRITALCGIVRGENIPKIVAGKLIAYNTGTFTTAAGQTPNPQWLYPGKTYDYNDWMDTQIGTLFDGVITNDALRDAAAPNLWKGQTPAMTGDGIHPSSTGYITAAIEAKTVMDAVFL